MGKKDKKKKGGGHAKTMEKTAKKQTKQFLKDIGEEDIEKILEDLNSNTSSSSGSSSLTGEWRLSGQPSARCSATFSAAQQSNQLYLFGGEYFDGQRTSVYNDLFSYDIEKNEWKVLDSSTKPPPRSAHQTVAIHRTATDNDTNSNSSVRSGEHLLTFGGEFTSPSSSQFHHYRDWWLFDLSASKWEEIKFKTPKKVSSAAVNAGPSARSGHRMLVYKSRVFVFGGFFDNGRTVQYFNDLHVLDLDTLTFTSFTEQSSATVISSSSTASSAAKSSSASSVSSISPAWPSARSGFLFWCDEDNGLGYVYGGFREEKAEKKKSAAAAADAAKGKKDKKGNNVSILESDRRVYLSDLWCLNLNTLSWTQVKKQGLYPSPQRAGMSCAVLNKSTGADKNWAVLFGGIHDYTKEEKRSQKLLSNCKLFSDIFIFDHKSKRFFGFDVAGSQLCPDEIAIKNLQKLKEKRKKEKEKLQAAEGDTKQEIEKDDEDRDEFHLFDFTQVSDALDKVDAGKSESAPVMPVASSAVSRAVAPSPRFSANVLLKSGVLWLFGGKEEIGHTIEDSNTQKKKKDASDDEEEEDDEEDEEEKERTLNDLYCLDVSKAAKEWKCVNGSSVEKWIEERDEEQDADENEDENAEREKHKQHAQVDDDDDEEEEEDDD